MFIRNPCALIPVIALSIVPVSRAAAAQDAQTDTPAAAKAAAPPAAPKDAPTLLAAVRQAMGKEIPAQVRLTASGSGYTPAADPSAPRQHYRIESYVLELNTGSSTASERVVRAVADVVDGAKPEPQGGTREVSAKSPWSDQHVLWTTPLGFLAAAAARPPSLRSETLFGTLYQVLTVSAPGGQQVHGYVDASNRLERTRTEVDKVPVEFVFMSWQDFDGLTFPSLIIRNENGQLSRVLVVTAVEQTAQDAGTPSKPSD